MSDALGRFRLDYHPLMLRQLARQDEAGLGAAYDLGRSAMLSGIGLLDVVRVHHELLLDVLGDCRGLEEAQHVAGAGGDLLVDLLAAYEMSQRGFLDIGLTGREPGEA